MLKPENVLKIKFQTQKFLNYLSDFNKLVYKMRDHITEATIDNLCCILMDNFDIDGYINGKLSLIQSTNIKRSLRIANVATEGYFYRGETKAGLPDGIGICKYYNGAVYKGELKAGQKEGRGLLKDPCGNEYDGEFKAGKLEGRVRYKSRDDYKYD